MSHLTLDDEKLAHLSNEELVSLLKRDLQNGFQLDEMHTLSTLKDTKTPVKRRKGPQYRRIKTYFKSIKQYNKERDRRKQILHLYLVKHHKQRFIADKLGISLSTIKRDLKKLRRFIIGQNNRVMRLMQEEWDQERERRMDGLKLRERFDVLSKELEIMRNLWQQRGYRGHYKILYVDMTQVDKYGIPKLTFLPRQTANKTVVYPYKIKVVVKGRYEGKIFEAELGSLTITQTSRW